MRGRSTADSRAASVGTHRSTDSIDPSRIDTRRGSEAASSRSWVMITIVRPSAWSSRQQVHHGAAGRESRLPVGSSARTIDGRLTIARAMATRWRSPPESCARGVVESVPETDAVAAPRRRPRGALPELCRGTAGRWPRCRARSSPRAGRTAGTRTRSAASARRTAGGRTSARCRRRRRERCRWTADRACR